MQDKIKEWQHVIIVQQEMVKIGNNFQIHFHIKVHKICIFL